MADASTPETPPAAGATLTFESEYGDPLGRAILKALGLPTAGTSRVVLDVPCDGPVRVHLFSYARSGASGGRAFELISDAVRAVLAPALPTASVTPITDGAVANV